MKKLLFFLLSLWGIPHTQAQQIIDLQSGKLTKGIASTVPTRNIEKLEDGYKVTYSFEKALILPDSLFNGTMFWKMDGFGMNQIPGEPSTLFRNDMIAIPSGYSAKVEVIDSTYHDYDYELTPARQPLLNSNNEFYTKKNVLTIKPYVGFKPATVASLSEIQYYRGHGICLTEVSPIQYNYKTKTVRAYSSITYKVSFVPDKENVGIGRKTPKHLSCEDNFLTNNAIGGELEKTNETNVGNTAQADVQDYLILSTNTYATAANRFAAWKRLMGFNVHVILRDDWTSASVKSTVSDAYSNMPALYFLLIIGDHDDVPAQSSFLKKTHVTDFFYRCMDNDYTPEIYSGRLSVSTSEEAITVIEKIIGYEQNPPTNSAFYNNGLHCTYFQDDNRDSYEDRRFTLTTEEVRTYVMSKGKSIQRVYNTYEDVTPLYWNNAAFANGGTIPNELKKPGFAWDGNYTDINNAINNGVFYVLHRDHGAVWGWGWPQYTQQNINNLSNGNLLPIVFSMNCQTGKFDDNCFAETFLRKSNGGCVAIYGATEDSYSIYNEALTTGMFDAIWPNPGLCINIPGQNNSFSITPNPTYTLGQILEQGMVRVTETFSNSSTYSNYTKEIYHCFGDPSMKMYTQVPTPFTNVSIVCNESSILVNLGANDTGRITAYNPISGEVQSLIGNSATIMTPNPNETIICVSAHNRRPFIQVPNVSYIQNKNITGTLEVINDTIKIGSHVTSTMVPGNVTTSNANIVLRAKKVILDSGTYISKGSSLKTVNP